MKIILERTMSCFFSDTSQEEDYHFYDIIVDGHTVGTIDLLDHFNDINDVCYVERIDIDEDNRGKGIGTEVLTKALWDICGYRSVVVAPDNERAKSLYERIGKEYEYQPWNCETDFGYNDQGYGVYVI